MKLLLNKQGGILIAVLIIVIVLSVAASFLVRAAVSDNKVMRNIRNYRENFNKADSGINFLRRADNSWLLSSSPLLDDENSDPVISNSNFLIKNCENDLVNLCEYKISRIQNDPDEKIKNNSDEFFIMPHKAPCVCGLGTSGKKFEVRRFGIKTISRNKQWKGCVSIEAGLYKFFPKAD